MKITVTHWLLGARRAPGRHGPSVRFVYVGLPSSPTIILMRWNVVVVQAS